MRKRDNLEKADEKQETAATAQKDDAIAIEKSQRVTHQSRALEIYQWQFNRTYTYHTASYDRRGTQRGRGAPSELCGRNTKLAADGLGGEEAGKKTGRKDGGV